jgi:hypothetical protein
MLNRKLSPSEILQEIQKNLNYCMNPKHAVLFILFLLPAMPSAFAQKHINYGSNNGKYLMIFNKRVYYEEYGSGIPLILLEGGMKSRFFIVHS